MPEFSPHFLNLDVYLFSKVDLTPLIEFFGNRVFVLYSGKIEPDLYRVDLETTSYRIKHSPERYIQEFLDLFDSIPEQLIPLWRKRKSIVFDIGIQGGAIPPPYPTEPGAKLDVFFSSLGSKTLSRIGTLKGTIEITVYPFDPQPNQAFNSDPSATN